MSKMNMKNTEKRLAEVFRETGLMSRIGNRLSNIRRQTNVPRTIRHWSPTDGFVPMTLGG